MDNKKGLLILGILGGAAAIFAATRKSSAETPPPEPPPEKTLIYLNISPANRTMDLGDMTLVLQFQQYQAIGTYSDGSTADLTTQAVWSSSDPTVATVDSTGKALPLKAGETIISGVLTDIPGIPAFYDTHAASLIVIDSRVTPDPGTGPYSFSLRGVNLPPNASGWSAAFFDFAGNSFQRLNDTLILSGENGIENFQTPVSQLQAVVVVWESNIQGGDGSNSSSTISTTLIPSIIVQSGQTYVFDLSQTHLI